MQMFRRLTRWFRKLSFINKILVVLTGLGAILIAGFALLIGMVAKGFFGPLPADEELRSISHPLAAEVYSADSVLLGKYYIQDRSAVPFDRIAPEVIQALIATEDIRFYKHKGVDYRSLARVLVKSILLQKESSGGGSTITQQLAKNLYPRQRYRFFSIAINKIREALIALRLEQLYTKEEILALYLNTIPFGDNTFGIQAAAERFFSTSASKLTYEQAAVLIGMLKATHTYNPRLFPERSRGRRNVVLSQLGKYGFIPQSKVDSLQALPVELKYQRITHHSGLAPYFRAHIKDELIAWCRKHLKKSGEPYNLYTDGLKIYTTIDSKLQEYAEAAVRVRMKALQEEFDNHWKKQEPWAHRPKILQDAIKRSYHYRRLKEMELPEEEIMKIMNEPVPMTVFTWDGDREMNLSPIDSVKHYLRFLNAGFLAMNPRDGRILAWVGGIDHNYFQYDHVRKTTRRQVGSTFKPFVYATALESGVHPCDYVPAEKTVYTNLDNWSPANNEDNYGMKYSMEGALAYSVNTVSVRLLEQGGISNTVALARRAGITADIPEVPSIALGTASISMIEMVAAYGSFVNDGMQVEPYYITAITDRRDSVLERFKPPKPDERVMSAENAALILEMLKRVVNEGTGVSLRTRYGFSNDIAGKTGTTQSNADGWFMALTPHMVVGTWVGASDPGIRFRTTSLGQGAHTALPIFAEFYKRVVRDPEKGRYTRPRFRPLSEETARLLDCDLFKEDATFLEKLFGKKDEDEAEVRAYGEKKSVSTVTRRTQKKKEKKEGFFQRLFGKKK
ncbi:MAG: transglycosylase domain-containing protein [Bacteroidota bacterium]|jgi:penicillin-binding protein 1A|nr:MAG: penicillin-binding protein [Bacteroidota bacterium]